MVALVTVSKKFYDKKLDGTICQYVEMSSKKGLFNRIRTNFDLMHRKLCIKT